MCTTCHISAWPYCYMSHTRKSAKKSTPSIYRSDIWVMGYQLGVDIAKLVNICRPRSEKIFIILYAYINVIDQPVHQRCLISAFEYVLWIYIYSTKKLRKLCLRRYDKNSNHFEFHSIIQCPFVFRWVLYLSLWHIINV